MKIALLGGSFNPPHLAHQLACLYLLEAEGFERVWMMPCYRHAFLKELVDFEQRVAMCALCARLFAGRVVVSEVERAACGEGANLTVDTFAYLAAHHPQHDFTLVIGSDILPEINAWKDFDRIREKYPILVLARPDCPIPEGGWQVSPALFPGISSTAIRARLDAGESVAGMLPRSVIAYIEKNRLYGVSSP
ncbi:MAG TPA: nicotinate-nicotinamide nucleotide adenylyltransferase [Myxococcota bacterium]|nr:nicotinate-nicotinamide nucleotide adenylyltransferase [Myxococcota bacterium]